MAGAVWRPIRGVDVGRVRDARLQAHHAVQWLARAARAFVPPQPDDSHTNLAWDHELDGFTTHPLAGDSHLGLRVAELALVFTGSRQRRARALGQCRFLARGRTLRRALFLRQPVPLSRSG